MLWWLWFKWYGGSGVKPAPYNGYSPVVWNSFNDVNKTPMRPIKHYRKFR